jgi:hypothetical protein
MVPNPKSGGTIKSELEILQFSNTFGVKLLKDQINDFKRLKFAWQNFKTKLVMQTLGTARVTNISRIGSYKL